MPFAKVNKKKKAAVSPEIPREETTQVPEKKVTLLSEEGLFDIAYDKYKKAHPESGMTRRDFRRNIWGGDELSEYLSEEQYKQYLSYISGETPLQSGSAAAVNEEIGNVEEPMIAEAADEMLAEDAFDEDALFGGVVAEEDQTDNAALSDEGEKGALLPELEGSFDDSLLEELNVVEAQAGELGEDSFSELASESSEYPADGGDIYAAVEDPLAQENPPEKDFIASPLDDEVSALEERADVVQEKNSITEQEVKKEEEAVSTSVQMAMRSDMCNTQSEVVENSENSATEDMEHSGVFAIPGVMGKLRKSMFLNEGDSSMDGEILQMSKKEVFEQLIRLEGIVRKVGVISDIAQKVFGSAEKKNADVLPSKERLLEIIANATCAIGYMMHFACEKQNTEEWNRAIAMHLGLSDEERKMNFVPEVNVNDEYVIKCEGMAAGWYIGVRGDYTNICRALFVYEQLHACFNVDGIVQYLNSVDLECWSFSDDSGAVVEDIRFENGQVYLV